MISLMTYVSAERTGHATESRKITLPPRVSPSDAPFFHARITCYASNKCPFQRSTAQEVANVGVKLSEGVELPNIDVATNVITLRLITVESR